MNIGVSVIYFFPAGDCNWVQKNSSKGQSCCKAELYNVINIKVLGSWHGNAAFQYAVLVFWFKNNFVTFTFTGLIDKFANGLHLKQGKFRSVCWNYVKKHFRQNKAHLGLFVLTRPPVDVNLNVNLMYKLLDLFFLQLYLVFISLFFFQLPCWSHWAKSPFPGTVLAGPKK